MKKLISFVTVGLLAFGLFAQESVKSLEEEYYDYLSLVGEVERPYLGYRSFSDSVWNVREDSVHPWMNNNLGTTFKYVDLSNSRDNFYLKGVNPYISLKYYGPEWYNSYNTKNPYGYNDGGLWQGAGYNTALTGGVHFEAFGFEASFKPQLSFSQNKAYDYIPGVSWKGLENCSPFNYYSQAGGSIDLVQRYGDSPFFNFDFGDSELRYTFYNWTIGFGTSNPWLGPAYVNPMLGSNNAGSYPKVDIGLKKTKLVMPWDEYYLGDIELRASCGMLSESKYFDQNPENDRTMLNMLSIGVSPSFIPGLTVGGNRIIISSFNFDSLKYFGRLFTYVRDNDETGPGEDQKISVYFDWLFPSVGFEVYGEYGMDDFSMDRKSNLFHSGIYTFGFKKDIPLWKSAKENNVTSMLVFEFNNFEMSQDFHFQWGYAGYYSHSRIMQGYTNNGQILGAGTGYYGNSQYLAYEVYYPKGKTMLFFQRSCPDNNYIYNKTIGELSEPDAGEYFSNNVAFLDFGLQSSYFITSSFIVNGSIVYDLIHNWKYERGYDIKNFHFELGLKYNF